VKGPSGAYSYCLQCLRFAKCSIWWVFLPYLWSYLMFSCSHLPVRGQMLQCSICAHGGHADCYRSYYTSRPAVELPARPSPVHSRQDGRSTSRSQSGSFRDEDEEETATAASEDSRYEPIGFPSSTGKRRKTMGYPCAAGCGHYCWAAVDMPQP
jgi:hypothetical protein